VTTLVLAISLSLADAAPLAEVHTVGGCIGRRILAWPGPGVQRERLASGLRDGVRTAVTPARACQPP